MNSGRIMACMLQEPACVPGSQPLIWLPTEACNKIRRIQELLENSSPDPSMAGALPPGAWWEYADSNSPMPVDPQPYGPNAGCHHTSALHADLPTPSCFE